LPTPSRPAIEWAVGGATGVSDPRKYLPVVFTRIECREVTNRSPLIDAFEQENIANGPFEVSVKKPGDVVTNAARIRLFGNTGFNAGQWIPQSHLSLFKLGSRSPNVGGGTRSAVRFHHGAFLRVSCCLKRGSMVGFECSRRRPRQPLATDREDGGLSVGRSHPALPWTL
jgi:hypothetical protein